MANLAELVQQREELDAKIAEALKEERAEDLAYVKEKIKLHSFTMTELRSVIKTRKRKAKAKTDT